MTIKLFYYCTLVSSHLQSAVSKIWLLQKVNNCKQGGSTIAALAQIQSMCKLGSKEEGV